MLVWIAVLFAVGGGGFLIFDLWKRKRDQGAGGKRVRVLVSQKVGKDKLYLGEHLGYEKYDPILGHYLYVPRIKKAISSLSHTDYFPDQKYGRCVFLCKYGEDDYRPMGIIKEGSFLVEKERSPSEMYETEEVKTEAGETKVEFKYDKDGKLIPLVDEEGNTVESVYYERFQEPIGVNQNDREAQRFTRDHVKRMEDKRKDTQRFWEKYGTYIIFGSFAIVMLLGFAYGMNKIKETAAISIETCGGKIGEKLDANTAAMNEPHWTERVLGAVQNRETQENAPPD